MEAQKSRCNEIQVLKFGQLIDLEMVDKVKLLLVMGSFHTRFVGVCFSIPAAIQYSIRCQSTTRNDQCTFADLQKR